MSLLYEYKSRCYMNKTPAHQKFTSGFGLNFGQPACLLLPSKMFLVVSPKTKFRLGKAYSRLQLSYMLLFQILFVFIYLFFFFFFRGAAAKIYAPGSTTVNGTRDTLYRESKLPMF